MLLATSFTYLILTLPFGIYLMTMPHMRYYYSSRDEYVGANRLWHAISTCMIDCNHSINFFLYCISGKKFRDELKSMMICDNFWTGYEPFYNKTHNYGILWFRGSQYHEYEVFLCFHSSSHGSLKVFLNSYSECHTFISIWKIITSVWLLSMQSFNEIFWWWKQNNQKVHKSR